MAIDFDPSSVLVRSGDPVTGPYYIIIAQVPDGTTWQDIKDWVKSQIPGGKLDIYVNLSGRRNDTGWVRVVGMRNFKQVRRLIKKSPFRGHQILAHNPGYSEDGPAAVLIRAPFFKDTDLFVNPNYLPPSPPSPTPSTGGHHPDAARGQAAPTPLMLAPTPPSTPNLSLHGQAPYMPVREYFYPPVPVSCAPLAWAATPMYCLPPLPPPLHPPSFVFAAEDRQLAIVWKDPPPHYALIQGAGYPGQAQAQTQATNLEQTGHIFRAAMATSSSVEKLDYISDRMLATFRTRDEVLRVGWYLNQLEDATAWPLRGGPVYFHPEVHGQKAEVSIRHSPQRGGRDKLTLALTLQSQAPGVCRYPADFQASTVETYKPAPAEAPKPKPAETPMPAPAETPKLAPCKLGSDTVLVVNGSSTRHLVARLGT
ncbi:hypothetical protein B0T25DRAFT_52665 [Lasiosphaeria hispida]|uniref:RRM domain-containing protein n=1 Tax=Lasiosphaeria hispida TaxID=260671 RepID=A0AAJ0MKC7_9PEZI|nr:hypothetical protein B0T25DRAFT_52665 [Lasiosphaeria hispida]